MSSPFRTMLTIAVMAAAIAAPLAHAKDKEELPPATTMVTVYITGHGGSEISKALNASYAKMEAEGWHFADVELHTENGDTKGALVTYTK